MCGPGEIVKILYAGDSPAGGAANYLLGVLGSMKAEVTHVPPSDHLLPEVFKKKFDAVILSDFSKKNLPAASENLILERVRSGTGLLMVGGWGSFSGPFGGWKGSEIEKVLPVNCLNKDDRTNFPGGAVAGLTSAHASVKGISFAKAPVICGMNAVLPKKEAVVVLHARQILSDGKKAALDSKAFPLLVTGAYGKGRTAAFTCDFAPHWCGGLVDWGTRTLTLPVTSSIRIQVGDAYVRLITTLLRWLARA